MKKTGYAETRKGKLNDRVMLVVIYAIGALFLFLQLRGMILG